jgi:neutral ceramidase
MSKPIVRLIPVLCIAAIACALVTAPTQKTSAPHQAPTTRAAKDAGWYTEGDFAPTHRVRIAVSNPLPFSRTDCPVVITRAQFPDTSFSEADIFVVDPALPSQPDPAREEAIRVGSGIIFRETNGHLIPFQLDDLDKDGVWDELFFMSNFGPSETKTFFIYIGRNDRGIFEHETHAELGNYGRHLVPWWESKTMGWKLWYPTDVDLYGKRRPMLVADHEDTLNISGYTAGSVYGNDIMTVEDTFGAGGICLFEDAQNPASPSRPRFSPTKGEGQLKDTRYAFDIVANGPLRSIISAYTMGWKTGRGEYELEQLYSAYKNKSYSTVRLRFLKFNPQGPGVRLGCGIRKLPNESELVHEGGVLMSLARDVDIFDPDVQKQFATRLLVRFLGTALVVKEKYSPEYCFTTEYEGNHLFALPPIQPAQATPTPLSFDYLIAAGWSEGSVNRTPAEFKEYVRAAAQEYNHPVECRDIREEYKEGQAPGASGAVAVQGAAAVSGREAQVNSEGEPLRVPPSDARPISSASLPPLRGRGMKPRPATEGSYPLGSPNERLPVASHGAYSPLVKVGLGEEVITPPTGVPMAGYLRTGVSTGVHDDLHARSLVIEGADGTPVVMMTVSIINLDAKVAGGIRAKINAETGIPEGNILISCTHTHSGPDLRGTGKAYTEFLVSQAAKSAVEAWRSRVPGRVGTGATEVLELGRNDPRLEYGGLHPDPEVGLIKVEDSRGKLLGVAFNYGCHPSTLDLHNLEFTEDWPYYAIRHIKKALGENVWAAYFQSAQGDIKVGYSAELSAVGAAMPIRNFWYAEVKGKQMAEAVAAAVPGIATSANPDVRVVSGDLDLPLRETYPMTAKEAEAWKSAAEQNLKKAETRADIGKRVLDKYKVDAFLAGLAVDCARWVEANPHPAPLRTRLFAARLGDAVFVTFPCEVFSEIGLKVKQGSPVAKTFVFGVAGGLGGYIPTAAEYKEGGYAVTMTHFSPRCKEVLVAASLELIKRALAAGGKSAFQVKAKCSLSCRGRGSLTG